MAQHVLFFSLSLQFTSRGIKMAHFPPCSFNISNGLCTKPIHSRKNSRIFHGNWRKASIINHKGCVVNCCSTSTSSSSSSSSLSAAEKQQVVGLLQDGRVSSSSSKKEEFDEYLVTEFGWKVRKLAKDELEMREVAQIQAEAFHTPMALFDDLFFDFFKAEVLAGLLYKLRNSPPNRYACLVAEAAAQDSLNSQTRLVGVVDATALRDGDVLQHLRGADEYLYISGIAVSKSLRRQKIGSVLLKACDALSNLLGFEYLVLRAYEDDLGARKLYSNAGYTVVSSDPPWITWIGRKRRVLMIKRSNLTTN